MDQVGTFADKQAPQLGERPHHVPAVRLFDRDQARAAAVERRLERAAGIEHRDCRIVSAPREPGRECADLALAATDAEIADEEKYFHGDSALRRPASAETMHKATFSASGRTM